MKKLIGHHINGKEWFSSTDLARDIFDPGTGEVTSSVQLGDKATLEHAVSSAKVAFESWGTAPISLRTRIFFLYRDLLDKNIGEIARAISLEHGKTIPDAIGEIRRGIEVVEFACGIGQLQKTQYSEGVSRGIDTFSIRQPLGVVAGITPFNFPAMVPMWMYPIAIAMGNTFILKPSEKDPSASLLLAQLFYEAGLPEGVLNVVQGDKLMVDAILDHDDIRAVSFVGSTPVARYIYQRAATNAKRVQALGGAKNHMVVLPDADMEAAADAVVSAAFGSAGERCMAISALVAVGDDVADTMTKLIMERISHLKVGYGSDDGVDMGPLVSGEHRDLVADYVGSAVAEGADVLVDGRLHSSTALPGFYLGPTLVDRVRNDMSVYKNEIFGPVLSVLRVTDSTEALALINANPYANGASIFTNSGVEARRFQTLVAAGMVGINVSIPVPVSYFSFGGSKDSLFGDTHIYGEEGVKFYTRGKVVTQRWPVESLAKVDFGFPQN